MNNSVIDHYSGSGGLSEAILQRIKESGKNLDALTTEDLAPVDEFHIRGRKATLEIAEQLMLDTESHVLDIGSGLGGPARTVAEDYGCYVTGVDLAQEFCIAADTLSKWVGLRHKVRFQQGDATDLPFPGAQFDAAMSIHVSMNIPTKDEMYREARRVLKPGGIFGVYDVLQGEGGGVLYPVPWAREPSISYLVTPDEMKLLLTEAGFRILDIVDSTKESQVWFEEMTTRMAQSGPPPVTFQAFLGDDFPNMARNQVRNIAERRIRTVRYVCQAR